MKYLVNMKSGKVIDRSNSPFLSYKDLVWIDWADGLAKVGDDYINGEFIKPKPVPQPEYVEPDSIKALRLLLKLSRPIGTDDIAEADRLKNSFKRQP